MRKVQYGKLAKSRYLSRNWPSEQIATEVESDFECLNPTYFHWDDANELIAAKIKQLKTGTES